MGTVLLAMSLWCGQAPDAGAWTARLAEDELQGERVLQATVTLVPNSQTHRVQLFPSWGPPRTVDLEGDEALRGVGDAVESLLDAGPATVLVLTLDTRLRLEVARPAVRAALERGLRPELRFAGPTRLAGQPMPEVLKLNKDVPPAPPLTPAQLRGVFTGAYGEVRACYQRQLEDNTLEGRLVVELDVLADGRVERAAVRESQLSAPQVERCVVQVVAGLRFPKLRGAPQLHVAWPFRFEKAKPNPPPPPVRK